MEEDLKEKLHDLIFGSERMCQEELIIISSKIKVIKISAKPKRDRSMWVGKHKGL